MSASSLKHSAVLLLVRYSQPRMLSKTGLGSFILSESFALRVLLSRLKVPLRFRASSRAKMPKYSFQCQRFQQEEQLHLSSIALVRMQAGNLLYCLAFSIDSQGSTNQVIP